MTAIKPIFKDVSHPGLLKSCLESKTQNLNMSFNSTLWKYYPKSISSSRKVAENIASISTVIFNNGNKGIIEIMKHFGYQNVN